MILNKLSVPYERAGVLEFWKDGIFLRDVEEPQVLDKINLFLLGRKS